MEHVIPDTFKTRKNQILQTLSTSPETYTDASPKGAIDEEIRGLIDDVNRLEGLVTTSSCAGRVSVFVEGGNPRDRDDRGEEEEEEEGNGADDQGSGAKKGGGRFAASGGKGSGRWLYVSHKPMSLADQQQQSYHDLFGLVPGNGVPPGGNIRLVRFHFEPMILHIMTATLKHAQPVLSAASSAGFRESGLQSLRCLDAASSSHPIVAVRSAGLALESIIGYHDETAAGGPVIRSLVTEEYLAMLVAMSNERFVTNKQRMERFRSSLLELLVQKPCSLSSAESRRKKKHSNWEDESTRRERMRAEGLQRQREAARSKDNRVQSDSEEITDIGLHFLE